MKPFLIFALPRSMTAWSSCFLTIGDVYCHHETPMTVPEIVDFMLGSPFDHTGIADPGLLLRWRELTEAMPDARLIYLRRPNYQSQRALAETAGVDPATMEQGFQCLSKAADDFIQHCEPKVIDWKRLATSAGACELWEAATGRTDVPTAHVMKMISLHIQQRPEFIQASVRAAMEARQ